MNLHLKTDGQSGLQGGQLNNLKSQDKTVREQEQWPRTGRSNSYEKFTLGY